MSISTRVSNPSKLVILIGDVYVGKTCLLSRYLKNQLPRAIGTTIGVEFATKNVTMKDGATVKAQLWDTAGQEKYRAITVAHYRKALGALVVYDITKRQTFDNVKFWLESLMNQAEQSLCIMLVGNKLDLVTENAAKRQVPQDEVKRLCEQYQNMKCIETSSVSKVNVHEAFETLLHDIYSQRQNAPKSVYAKDPLKIYEDPNQQSKGGCC